MTADQQRLQTLLDRTDIHDVLLRYFDAADRGDKARMRSCFTDDACAEYDRRPPAYGLDDVIGQIRSFDKQASGEWRICTHFLGNVQFRSVTAASAETESNVFAFLVLPGSPSDRVEMRSLRYLDRFARIDGEWKIRSRLHTLDWQCEVPAGFSRTMNERRHEIPAHLLLGG